MAEGEDEVLVLQVVDEIARAIEVAGGAEVRSRTGALCFPLPRFEAGEGGRRSVAEAAG
jgi:hypothetical protein